jgi:hypothetical protein
MLCNRFAYSRPARAGTHHMFDDFTIFLWLLKLGALVNLHFLANTYLLASITADAHVLVPARILFAVSAYRCLFPVQYTRNVVFHSSPFSSIFLTRLFATFSEVAYVYLFSHVIRLLNRHHVGWVNLLSWVMVLQVLVSQGFVWGAILTDRLILYYWEELGWANIFAINTTASAYLYVTVDKLGGAELLIYLSVLFGVVYLPWQIIHLRALHSSARHAGEPVQPETQLSWKLLKEGLGRSIRVRNRASDADAWGGLLGLTWMTGYWATLIPMWVNQVVVVFSRWKP